MAALPNKSVLALIINMSFYGIEKCWAYKWGVKKKGLLAKEEKEGRGEGGQGLWEWEQIPGRAPAAIATRCHTQRPTVSTPHTLLSHKHQPLKCSQRSKAHTRTAHKWIKQIHSKWIWLRVLFPSSFFLQKLISVIYRKQFLLATLTIEKTLPVIKTEVKEMTCWWKCLWVRRNHSVTSNECVPWKLAEML